MYTERLNEKERKEEGRERDFLRCRLLLEIASLKFIWQTTKNQFKFYKRRKTWNSNRFRFFLNQIIILKTNYFSFGNFFFLKASNNWIRPIHLRNNPQFYSKLTDVCVNHI